MKKINIVLSAALAVLVTDVALAQRGRPATAAAVQERAQQKSPERKEQQRKGFEGEKTPELNRWVEDLGSDAAKTKAFTELKDSAARIFDVNSDGRVINALKASVKAGRETEVRRALDVIDRAGTSPSTGDANGQLVKRAMANALVLALGTNAAASMDKRAVVSRHNVEGLLTMLESKPAESNPEGLTNAALFMKENESKERTGVAFARALTWAAERQLTSLKNSKTKTILSFQDSVVRSLRALQFSEAKIREIIEACGI